MTTGEGSPEAGSGASDAAVGPLARLLDVQDHDTVVDQLRHRRATLPERAQLGDVDRRLGALEARTKELRLQRDELGDRQAALEQQIGASRSRREALEKRLYGGQVVASRELQAMSEEVKHLARHINELEDREIEVMESLEPLDGELQAGDVTRRALDADAQRLRTAIETTERALDGEIAEATRARAAAASEVRAELMTRYEQLRSKLGGTGAARLVGASCGGCHLTLSSMELDRVRKAPPDAVITCEQCGRILVH
ncbi:MAG TPA: C4-type zinc ribbon domain-containing protein [Acidimicrobiales bacterium]|nr:C4-type zinc ribbon domain-containing protein [Acidimicrobiales bacterium]